MTSNSKDGVDWGCLLKTPSSWKAPTSHFFIVIATCCEWGCVWTFYFNACWDCWCNKVTPLYILFQAQCSISRVTWCNSESQPSKRTSKISKPPYRLASEFEEAHQRKQGIGLGCWKIMSSEQWHAMGEEFILIFRINCHSPHIQICFYFQVFWCFILF